MSEKEEKKLTDKGWAALRPQLDRDMPVQRRRRRFAWFWWATALLLWVVGIDALKYFIDRQNPPAPPPAATPASPASKMPQAQAPSPSGHNGGSVEHSTEQPALDLTPILTPGKTGKHASIQASQVIALPPAAKTYASDAADKAEGQASAIEKEVTPAPALMGEKPTAEWAGFDPLPFAQMPSLESPALRVPSVSLSAPTVPVEKARPNNTRPQRWAFGAQASAIVTDFKFTDGYAAGIITDWQPLRHWGLRLGLGYRHEKPRQIRQPLAAVPTTDYVADTQNTDVENALLDTFGIPISQSATEVFVPVSQLHYLEVPLLAYWQPGKRWRLYGGLTVDYLLGVRATETYSVNNVVFNQYYLNTEKANALSQTTRRNLTTWQLDASVGSSLRLGKHVELGILYRTSGSPEINKRSYDTNQSVWAPPLSEKSNVWRQRLQVSMGLLF